MGKSKRLASGAMAAMLIIGAYAPAWAGPSQNAPTTPAQDPVAPGNDAGSLAGIMGSFLTEHADHRSAKQCKPGSMYTEHDVVGDPESCFINRLGIPSGMAGAPGFAGGIP